MYVDVRCLADEVVAAFNEEEASEEMDEGSEEVLKEENMLIYISRIM